MFSDDTGLTARSLLFKTAACIIRFVSKDFGWRWLTLFGRRHNSNHLKFQKMSDILFQCQGTQDENSSNLSLYAEPPHPVRNQATSLDDQHTLQQYQLHQV
ncbi:unnamed protein product [Polarella glacialis]|uniref:Uncharacterized protein n=1 Tax=Polarella glacialis TaxID=89957 RepID=A0A813LN90_POLGL|nr:unnamed protein product [Polarella glacialis]CAE8733088.1 unnamed protein product [Polarella glacialis]